MSKRFGRNQKRKLREELAGAHRVASDFRDSAIRARRRVAELEAEMRNSVVIKLDDRRDPERDVLTLRADARYRDGVMSYAHQLSGQEIVAMNLRDPSVGPRYADRLARMIFAKFRDYRR